ncbi:MAG: class I SAM-dependent methyltransferase [Cyclobacteriaceae bacterium]|nr:class I SAM-dependent methyltransferase [Cyclobacteriaceae bacterium]
MKMHGYDWLAPFYDTLARVVVGKQIQQMQLPMLRHLHDRKKLLVLGGGTGWILPHIFRVNPNLVIHYVDSSEKMIARARSNAHGNKSIQFIQGTETAISTNDYDAVLTYFYLDMFAPAQLTTLITKLKNHLVKEARWLVCDFESQTRMHRIKVQVMYLFFRIVTGLRTNTLPAWYCVLTQSGCIVLEDAYSADRFIRSAVFRVNIT